MQVLTIVASIPFAIAVLINKHPEIVSAWFDVEELYGSIRGSRRLYHVITLIEQIGDDILPCHSLECEKQGTEGIKRFHLESLLVFVGSQSVDVNERSRVHLQTVFHFRSPFAQ